MRLSNYFYGTQAVHFVPTIFDVDQHVFRRENIFSVKNLEYKKNA